MTIPSFENPSLDQTDVKPLYFGHLGGTSTKGDADCWFPELWTWLIEKFDLKSSFDVGCGIGLAQKFFKDSGLVSIGVDCKQVLEHHVLAGEGCVAWDFTKDGACLHKQSDLVWCCEVVEHIEEEFVNNILWTLGKNTNKVLAMTAAPPNADGHHHVNCKPAHYWVNLLEKFGLKYSQELTDEGMKLCGPNYGRGNKNYFKRNGMIFTRN